MPATIRAQVGTGPVSGQIVPVDSVAAILANFGFNSIVDGQPLAPDQWELLLAPAWQCVPGGEHQVILTAISGYTPAGSRFLRNGIYGLVVPVQLNGSGRGLGTLGPFWQQRWVDDARRLLSIATLLQVGFPTAKGSRGISFLLVGSGARALGRNLLYLNVFGQTSTTGSSMGWGGVAGYGWLATPRFAFVGDFTLTSIGGESVSSTLEFSPEIILSSRFAVGPGVFIGLSDRSTTPSYGFGVLITYVF